MSRRLLYTLKMLLAASLFVSVLVGCGEPRISETYPLESVNHSGSQTSYVYRAANRTVPDVARELAEQRQPEQMSKEDPERMFLVYPDELYHLQRDPDRPQDTIIEVDNKEYVRENYDPSFLQGFLLASLLDDLFDLGKRGTHGDYRGYTTRNEHKPNTVFRAPTEAERKAVPPITVQGSGTIIKRGKTAVSVGSDGKIFKKDTSADSSAGSTGKIIRSKSKTFFGGSEVKTKSGSLFSPRSHSPPKTRVGGFGKITRRR